MAVTRKMLPGYNHNVCYKGQICHIQTEDSGIEHPHIITLLFLKGNILARKKKDYGDIIGFDKLEDVVRELMQEQHKGMLRDLKLGKFDGILGLGPAPAGAEEAACPEPPPVAPKAPPAPAPAAARVAAPAPPPPAEVEEIQEKPASRTINLTQDSELKDEDIFGDMISSKSLDEVILTFLSKQIDEDEDN